METSQGTGVLDPVIKMEDFDWLGRLTAGMRSEGAKVGAVFFCQRSISAQPFFSIYSQIVRELQEAVNLEMSASVLFTANPPYGSNWLIQGNFALR